MLEIYKNIKLIDPNTYVVGNDSLFDLAVMPNESLVDDKVKEIMLSIDKAVYKPGMLMDTPFGKGASLSYLSTGCKTVINTYLFPQYCINASECGNNALLELLKLDKGSIYMYDCPYSDDNFEFNSDVLVHTVNYDVVCSDYEELRELY
jgi:hypothetical protein